MGCFQPWCYAWLQLLTTAVYPRSSKGAGDKLLWQTILSVCLVHPSYFCWNTAKFGALRKAQFDVFLKHNMLQERHYIWHMLCSISCLPVVSRTIRRKLLVYAPYSNLSIVSSCQSSVTRQTTRRLQNYLCSLIDLKYRRDSRSTVGSPVLSWVTYVW